MNKYNRYVLLVILCTAIFSGCQSSFVSSNNKNTKVSEPKNNASKASQSSYNNLDDSINFKLSSGALVDPGDTGNLVKSSLFSQNTGILYYVNEADGNKIYKMNLDGSGNKKVIDDSASELILFNNIVYYANESDNDKLYSANIDGTYRKKLIDEKVYNMVLLGNLIYCINSNNIITTVDISSGKKISLNIKSGCFDSDGTYIYYEDSSSNNVLSSVKVDGSEYGSICSDFPLDMVSQAGVIYYSNGWDNNRIYKISSDGSNKIKLNNFKSSKLEIADGWIYYINNSDFDKIYKIKTDGSGNAKVNDESFVKNFYIAGNYIFYTKNTDVNHSIYKINK